MIRPPLRSAGAAALGILLALGAHAAPPAPDGVRAFDTPNDGGRSLTVEWSPPAGAAADWTVTVERVDESGGAEEVGRVPALEGRFVDSPTAVGGEGPANGRAYAYRLVTIDPAGVASSAVVSGTATSSAQLFNRDRINILSILAVLFSFVVLNVARANRGERFYVRKLTPVVAMEEAIGRATEMGRPVLYVPGIEEVEDIQTIASMLILGYVAKETARYEVNLRVPTRTPFVMAVADEVIRSAYSEAGRPDFYHPEQVQYVSSEQFAYCAGVNGIILREKPAANFYLGRFFAESLILAETGFAAGSIQIAGTAEVTQLPFFIAACDYTLIGEEFFAAGAYLSGDPALLSTLKAADWAKILLVTLLVVGACLESFGISAFREWFLVR